MHVFSHFQDHDLDRAWRAMRDHPFALLITVHAGATHLTWLPFLLDATRGAHGTLEAHLARANPHAAAIEAGAPSTVAFLGPHGYVSAGWYAEPGRQVPTWNYVAVHAHGRPRPVTEPAPLLAMVERLAEAFERDRAPGWRLADARAYGERLAPHIVGFELPIERLEHQRKLSQNRSAADRAGVLAALAAEPGAGALRDAMLELYREDGATR